MTTGDELRIYVQELARALQQNLPAPPIPPDLPAAAQSEIDLLLAGLGMAANEGDPADMAASDLGFAEREAQTGEAMAAFPANEAQSAQALQQMMGMAQQIPQSLSGVGQSANGVFSSFFQQLNQALQQGVQAGQQLAHGGASSVSAPAEALGDALGAGGSLMGAGAAGVGGLGTAPASYLGPPATPVAATAPSSSFNAAAPAGPAESPGMARGGMGGGYPMMPPGATGNGGASGDAKADTKRVVPPSVKNGAPVQGRIATPPKLPEVTKRVEGKPVATRRIIGPDHSFDEGTESQR